MNEKEKNFISIGKASKLSGLCQTTLRRLSDEKKIRCYRTPSGQRRFDKLCLEEMFNPLRNEELRKNKRINYIYTRVSSKKQMDDLTRQIEFIRSKLPEHGSFITLSDIGSGINFRRKGLQTILDGCLQNTIGQVIVAHRDRLSRFGFELIRSIILKAGGSIKVIDDQEHKSTEQELAEDLLSIVHIYSCRQTGKRSYRKSKTDENAKDINKTEQESEENI
jgi:predicted site-specific integrase-resolvase